MSNTYRLVTGPPELTSAYMRRCLVRLAVHAPIRWLLCGNYLDLQSLIYAVAQRAGKHYYRVLQENIAISRAETCYQVVALLQKTRPGREPIFITDLLLQFYTNQVRDDEASSLFLQGLLALKELGRAAPVIVSASPGAERTQLFTALFQNAGRVTRLSGEVEHGS
jgi:hypothetical protein